MARTVPIRRARAPTDGHPTRDPPAPGTQRCRAQSAEAELPHKASAAVHGQTARLYGYGNCSGGAADTDVHMYDFHIYINIFIYFVSYGFNAYIIYTL